MSESNIQRRKTCSIRIKGEGSARMLKKLYPLYPLKGKVGHVVALMV
jgi:hypothetical protein